MPISFVSSGEYMRVQMMFNIPVSLWEAYAPMYVYKYLDTKNLQRHKVAIPPTVKMFQLCIGLIHIEYS